MLCNRMVEKSSAAGQKVSTSNLHLEGFVRIYGMHMAYGFSPNEHTCKVRKYVALQSEHCSQQAADSLALQHSHCTMHFWRSTMMVAAGTFQRLQFW